MRRIDGLHLPDWISNEAWRSSFPSYARVFHAAYELPPTRATDERSTLTQSPQSAASLSETVTITSFENSIDVPQLGIRITWADILASQGSEVVPESTTGYDVHWRGGALRSFEGSLDRVS